MDAQSQGINAYSQRSPSSRSHAGNRRAATQSASLEKAANLQFFETSGTGADARAYLVGRHSESSILPLNSRVVAARTRAWGLAGISGRRSNSFVQLTASANVRQRARDGW